MPPIRATVNITVPNPVQGNLQTNLLTITSAGYVGGDSPSLPTGFFLDGTAVQGFNGYFQEAATGYKSGASLKGVGIVLYGNAPTLSASTSFRGTVSLWRDFGGPITNTGDIATAAPGSFQVTGATSTTLSVRFNDFRVKRFTGGGIGQYEYLGLNGTADFVFVPGGK